MESVSAGTAVAGETVAGIGRLRHGAGGSARDAAIRLPAALVRTGHLGGAEITARLEASLARQRIVDVVLGSRSDSREILVRGGRDAGGAEAD